MGSLPDCCQVCGLDWPILEKAHVRPKRYFDENSSSSYDTDYNLVRLCPNHHKIMDKLKKLVICPKKKHVIIEPPYGAVAYKELEVPALIKIEYLETSYRISEISNLNSKEDAVEVCGCEL